MGRNTLVWAQGSYGTKTYVYDEIGNIIQKDGLTYSYAELNSRLDGTRAGSHAVTSLSDGTRFKYDANGNMAKLIKVNETTTYIYDPQNRLIAVDSQSTGINGSTPPLAGQARIAQYAYDGDGGRIKKTVYRRDKALYNVNVGSTLFETLGAPPKPATAANPTVEITKYVGQLYEIQGNRSTRFIYLGSTRVASVSGQDVMYYHTDHLGGTNALTDKAGLARELTEYDPFGSIIKHEKYGDDFGTAWYYFTGKPLDDETGLMYYGARYYNPKLGRFITADTIVPYASDPQSFNRYSYCRDNPVNFTDPTGHKFKWGKIFKAIGIAVAGAILTAFTGGLATALVGAFWGGIVTGAVAGATIGGSIAAATGGNIGQAMLTGAISGAIFGGIGGIGLKGLAETAAHTLGGAVSGVIDSSITGSDIGMGALIGGISAGATNWASSNIAAFKMVQGKTTSAYIQNMVRRATLGGLIGGGLSASFGGDFGDGFKSGFKSAAISYTANHFVHTAAVFSSESLIAITLLSAAGRSTIVKVAIAVLVVSVVIYLSENSDLSDKVGDISSKTGLSNKEVKDKIHEAKKNLPKSGPIRNPDVGVNTETGDIYPKTEGGYGDSIGNIFD